MAIDDSPEFFRRLVKLYLLFPIVVIVVAILEFAIGPWLEFSDEFDRLAATSFKPLISEGIWIVVGGVSIIAHYIGGFGLLRFKHWSRPLFILPIFLFEAVDIFLYGVPGYSSSLTTFLFFVDFALFGAIVLLCYGKNQGGIWFTQCNRAGDN